MLRRIICGLCAAIVLLLGATTFIEAAQGTWFVQQHIYGTWWFAALWMLLLALGTAAFLCLREGLPCRSCGQDQGLRSEQSLREGLDCRSCGQGQGLRSEQSLREGHDCRSCGQGQGLRSEQSLREGQDCRSCGQGQGSRREAGVLMIHASLLLILAGALATRIDGTQAQMHLRIGEPCDIMMVTGRGQSHFRECGFSVELTDFQLQRGTDGEARDYRSNLLIRMGCETCFDASASNSSLEMDASASYSSRAIPASVSMNRIFRHRGWRFSQLSFDEDLCGSTIGLCHDPWGIALTYAGYALFLLSFALTCLRRKTTTNGRTAVLAGIAAIAVAALWCLWYFVLDGSWERVPVLRTPLLAIHVGLMILAYALLLVQACLCAAALIRSSGKAPSLLNPALLLLCAGIIVGSLWAGISWGSRWSWDSKEVWALITLIVYAAPLHERALPAFRKPKLWNAWMLASFATVLMTYFGVNALLIGLHSY